MNEPGSGPELPPDVRDEREARIAELEAKLSRPSGVGVLPPIAALALSGALGLLWLSRDDVEYFFSSREPIELGSEGDYHFDRAITNRYAVVHGTPTVRGAYWQEKGSTYVAVGLRDTPVVVKRATLPSEEWRVGTTPPRPDQRPFSVPGRLVSRFEASKYEEAFAQHDKWGEVQGKWLLVADERPGRDLGAVAWFTGLIAFAGANLWLLVRGAIALVQRLRAK